jgi:large subunit ribosomal protein L25
VGKNTTLTVDVPVHFENEEKSPGLKKGGVLNIVRHTVEVSCPANSIPENLVIDLTGTEVGDSLHISAVTLPKGVTPTITDRDFTIATIAAPSALRSSEGAEDEAADEGETEDKDEE